MSASRRRREWCRLVLSAFLCAYTFVFFTQMTTYGELRAAVIDDNGQVDDGGQITCKDDDGDANTGNDDVNDNNSPDDDDDCAGGGGSGGSGGGGGGGGDILCPTPDNDRGHVTIFKSPFADIPDGQQDMFMPVIINDGQALGRSKYVPGAIIGTGTTVLYMEEDCCNYPDGTRGRITDGGFRISTLSGNGNIDFKYKDPEPPFHFVPLPSTLDAWSGVDVGCELLDLWRKDILLKLEGVQSGTGYYEMEFDPYELDLCPEFDGFPDLKAYFTTDTYRVTSRSSDPEVNFNHIVPMVYCDLDGDGINDNVKPVELIIDIEKPRESAPLGNLIFDFPDNGSDALFWIETPEGDAIVDGTTIQAQETQTFLLWPKDPDGKLTRGGAFTINYELPYSLDSNLWISDPWDGYESPDYHAWKYFGVHVHKVHAKALPDTQNALTADEGSPGWAEREHSLSFIMEQAVSAMDGYLPDGAEVEWTVKSGNGHLTEVLSSSQGSHVGTTSRIPPYTGESQEVEAHIKKMVFEHLIDGVLTDVVALTDITVPFPEQSVEPGQGDHVILTYPGSGPGAPSPSYPGVREAVLDLEIEVFDQYGNVVADGDPVDLRLYEDGDWTHIDRDNDPEWAANSLLLTENGKVSTQIRSNDLWEDQNFDIGIAAGVDSTELVQVNDVICTLNADKTQLDAGIGEQTLVTATFVDSEGQLVPDGTLIYAYCSHGSVHNATDNTWMDLTEPLLAANGQVQFIYDSTGAAIRSGNDVVIGASCRRSYAVLTMPIIHTGPNLHVRVVNELNKNRMTLNLSESSYSEEPFCLDNDGDHCDSFSNHVATKMEVVGNPNDVVTVSHFWPSDAMCHLFSSIAGGSTLPDECGNHDAQMFGGSLDVLDYVSEPSSLYLLENETIEITDHDDLSLGAHSFTLWAKLKGEETPEGLGYAGILMEKSGEYLLEVTSEGYLEWTVYTDQGSATLSSVLPLSPEMWLPIHVGVRDGVQYLKINQHEEGVDITGNLVNTSNNLVVGDGFEGYLDDFMLKHVQEYFGDSSLISVLGVDANSQLVLDSNGLGLIELQSLGNWVPRSESDLQMFMLKVSRNIGPASDDDDDVIDEIFAPFITAYRAFLIAYHVHKAGTIIVGGLIEDAIVSDIAYYDGHTWHLTDEFLRDPVNILGQKEQQAGMFVMETFTSFGAAVELWNFGGAMFGPERIELFAYIRAILAVIELGLLYAMPAAKPFAAQVSNLVEVLEKIPTRYSDNVAILVKEWLIKFKELGQDVLNGDVGPDTVEFFLFSKMPLIEILAKRAEEMPLNEFQQLIEAIADTPRLLELHGSFAGKMGTEKYDQFLSKIFEIQNDARFAINGLTSKEVALKASEAMVYLKGDKRLKLRDGEVDIENFTECMAWMAAKTNADSMAGLKAIFFNLDLPAPVLSDFVDSMIKISKNNPEDKVNGIKEFCHLMVHPQLDDIMKLETMSKFSAMARLVDVPQPSGAHIGIHQVEFKPYLDLPLFYGKLDGNDVDYWALHSYDAFKDSSACLEMGPADALFHEFIRHQAIYGETPLKCVVVDQAELDLFQFDINTSNLPIEIKDALVDMFVIAP